ncbi:MAG: SAM-dependent methyltransferase [Tissierellia bacterium]|nr:SAM-dependent methyltransferase [Tissierellia bacterium]
MTDNKVNCLICDAEIEYLENAIEMKCSSCGKFFTSNARCENKHFICDSCHSKKGIAVIKAICIEEQSKNPIEIFEKICHNSNIHMHGPEHHVLVGVSLLTAFYNANAPEDRESLEKDLGEMIYRGRRVPGGVCGDWGTCGASISLGILASILTKASPLTTDSWGTINTVTSKSLAKMGEIGGPRCCKRNGFIAIETGIDFIKEEFGVDLERTQPVCDFVKYNKECILMKCPYFPSHHKK